MVQHEQNKIGLFAATVIGVNAMIGAGIFAMPAKLSYTVGLAGVLSYIISGFLVLAIVFGLGRLAVLYPGDAWGYRYPALWGGHFVGMLSSMGYAGGVIVGMGFLTQQLGVWLAPLIGYNPLSIGIVLLAFIVCLVLAGAQVSSWGQYVIAACVLVPMVIASGVCLLNAQTTLMTPIAPYGFGAVVSVLPTILFSLLGFESISSLYSIVANPGRNVPRAATYAVALVVGIFALFIGSSLVAINKSFFIGGVDCPFSTAIVAVLPRYAWLAWVTSIGAFFAIFGTLHSMTWSVAELFLDTLRKGRGCIVRGCLSSNLVNGKTAVLLVGLATALSAIFLKADVILIVVVLFVSLAYLLSVMALLFNRLTWKSWSDIGVAVSANAAAAWLFGLTVRQVLALL